jgi:hypothetical protein
VRSYRELWLWLGGLFLALFPLLAAIAIAYFAKDKHYSLIWNGWMLGAIVSFLAAFTCFFGAIRGWPLPPLVKPEFPDIRVEIYGTGSMDTEREASTGLTVPADLRSFNVRFTNAEAERNASLTVLLYITLIPGSWGRVGEAACPPPDWALPPSLGLSPISMPFPLSPGEAAGGQLVYEVPAYYLDKIAEPIKARLELWDHVTGKRVNVRAEIGSHDRNQMTPSPGGAQMLGPEYGDEAGRRDGAGQASS